MFPFMHASTFRCQYTWKECTCIKRLEFIVMQELSRIKPQMMQKVLSSIGLSEDKKVDFAHVNCQAEGFNGRSETSSQAEMIEIFPVSTGFDPNPRITEKNIILPFAIDQTDTDLSDSIG
jgi:hypothetical protein